MFSGNEWVILVVMVAVLAVPVVIIVAVVLATVRRRGGSPAQSDTFVGAQHPGQAEQGPPAGWFPDPSGRSDQRYWNGFGWTDAVVTNGEPGTSVM